MDDAVDEVDVLLVEILGGVHGDDRLQRRRIAQRHLDRIETTPGDAEHAHVAVRPALPRQPVDHDFAVLMLDVGVLVGNQATLAVAGATDVDGCDDVAALHEIRVERVIAAARLDAAVGQVFQQHGKSLTRLAACRHVEIGGEPHAVRHSYPRFLHANAVAGHTGCRGCRKRRTAAGENQQADAEPPASTRTNSTRGQARNRKLPGHDSRPPAPTSRERAANRHADVRLQPFCRMNLGMRLINVWALQS